MGRRDANLLTAEAAFQFAFKELRKNDSDISTEIYNSLVSRIKERRQVNVVSLLKFLHNPGALSEHQEDEFFKMPSKTALVNTAKALMVRLFNTSAEEDEESESDQDGEEESSLESRLEQAITSQLTQGTQTRDDAYKSLLKEFNLYEATGKRTPNLDLLYNALIRIPPTSIESERAFSALGLFVTKLRSRLSSSSINMLSFLKAYYKSKQIKKKTNK